MKLLIYYIPFLLLHNFFLRIGIYSSSGDYAGKIITFFSFKELVINLLMTVLLMGREPILGTMWFFIVLIISLIGLTIVAFFIKKITDHLKIDFNKTMFLILFIILVISIFFTEIVEITIPRFSNSASMMILIFLGYYLNKVREEKYSNIYYFLLSFLILVTTTIFIGDISINTNKLINPITFLITSISGLYFLCYIAKKMQIYKISKLFEICGKYSFYIMVFHLLSFKLGALLYKLFDINSVMNLYDLKPNIHNFFDFIIFFVLGTVIPIVFAKLLEKLKIREK